MIDRPPITRDGAQHAAQRELSKPAYHRGGEPLALRAIKWFAHLTDRILGGAANHAPGGGVGAVALVALIMVVAGIIVWRVGIPRGAATVGAVLQTGAAMAAADHRRLAERAAGEGDFHTAVVERMRAVARGLEERGVLDPRPGRTATELTDDAARQLPGSSPTMRGAAASFNAVAYGDAIATADQLATIVAADDLVRQSRQSLVRAS